MNNIAGNLTTVIQNTWQLTHTLKQKRASVKDNTLINKNFYLWNTHANNIGICVNNLYDYSVIINVITQKLVTDVITCKVYVHVCT